MLARPQDSLLAWESPAPLFGSAGDLLVFASLSYRSATVQSNRPTPELNQPAYSLRDLGVVWTRQDNRWQLGLHGMNLTDEEYITAGFHSPTLGRENNVTAFLWQPSADLSHAAIPAELTAAFCCSDLR